MMMIRLKAKYKSSLCGCRRPASAALHYIAVSADRIFVDRPALWAASVMDEFGFWVDGQAGCGAPPAQVARGFFWTLSARKQEAVRCTSDAQPDSRQFITVVRAEVRSDPFEKLCSAVLSGLASKRLSSGLPVSSAASSSWHGCVIESPATPAATTWPERLSEKFGATMGKAPLGDEDVRLYARA
jgi:hypothetical protein